MRPGSEVKAGICLSIFWDLDKKWYNAEVLDYDPAKGICSVLYTDGEREEFDLTQVKHRILWGGKCRERDKSGDEGLSPKKQLEYIVETLLDIEDRLPPRGVFNNRKRWWQLWHSRVTNAGKSGRLSELVKSTVDIAFQMKDNVSTSWWKLQRADWQRQVTLARTSGALSSRVSDLLTKAVDWAAARRLFSEVSESGSQEQDSSGTAHREQSSVSKQLQTSKSGIRQRGMGKERITAAPTPDYASYEAGVKNVTSGAGHSVRRSKRKLVEKDTEEPLFVEPSHSEAPKVTAAGDMPSTLKRRKEGKTDGGHLPELNLSKAKKCNDSELRKDQNCVEVGTRKGLRRKGQSLEPREHEEGNANAKKIEIGVVRVKKSRRSFELDQSKAAQVSDTGNSSFGKRDSLVAEGSADVQEIEEIIQQQVSKTSLGRLVRTRRKIAGIDAEHSKLRRAGRLGGRNQGRSDNDGSLWLEQATSVAQTKKRGRPRKGKSAEIVAAAALLQEPDGTGKDRNASSTEVTGCIAAENKGLPISSTEHALPGPTQACSPATSVQDCSGLPQPSQKESKTSVMVETELFKIRGVRRKACILGGPVVENRRKLGRPKRIKLSDVGGKPDQEQHEKTIDKSGISGEVEQVKSLGAFEGAKAGEDRLREGQAEKKLGRPKKIKVAELLEDRRSGQEQQVEGAGNKMNTSAIKKNLVLLGTELVKGPQRSGPDALDSSADVGPKIRGAASESLLKETHGRHHRDQNMHSEEAPSRCPMKEADEHNPGIVAEDSGILRNTVSGSRQFEHLLVTESLEVAGVHCRQIEQQTTAQLGQVSGQSRDNLETNKQTGKKFSREEGMITRRTGSRLETLEKPTGKNKKQTRGSSKTFRPDNTHRHLSVKVVGEVEERIQDGCHVRMVQPKIPSLQNDSALEEEASGQRSKKRAVELPVWSPDTKVFNRGKKTSVRKKIINLGTRSSGNSAKETDSGCASDDVGSQEDSELDDSWGERLPTDSSDSEGEVRFTRKVRERSFIQAEHSLGQLSAVHDLLNGEEVCSICDFAGADDLMLLCDEGGCKCALHTFCLDPPLKSIPEGEWLCPHCAYENASTESMKGGTKKCCNASFPRKVIRAIIGRRTEPFLDDGKGAGKLRMQYLVKWDSLSHEHDTWIPEDWLLYMDSKMVMRFQRKNPLSTCINIDERRPEWSEIDRIIGCRRQGGKVNFAPSHLSAIQSREQDKIRLEFLVKWRGLDYNNATWEKGCETDEMQKAITDYTSRHEKAERGSAMDDEMKPSAASIRQQPEYLCGGMYGFQLHGLKWLLSNFEQGRSVILADEMGLGKTVQTLAFISCVRFERFSSRPVLVIAPKSTLPGWEQEFRCWAPGLNVVVYQGEKENRALIRDYEFYTESKKRPLFEVLLTSYELATIDNHMLSKFHWAVLVVDEGHRVKNVRSKLSTLLVHHKADCRLLLTGTPVQNTLSELFALLHFLDPIEFPDPENSARQFTQVDAHGAASQTDVIAVQQQVSKLHDLLKPRMLRRLKSEVLNDMIPGKKLVEVSCALTSLQRHLYVAILKKNFNILNKGAKAGMKRSLHTILIDLKMVCNHPYLFPGKEPQNLQSLEAFKLMVGASGKLQLLEKLLPLLKEGGHRVLLFSQMTKMLDILEDFVSHLGLSWARIDGSTSASDRQKSIAEFNTAGSPTFIFLISTRAGGLGINLPSADTVIIYDPDFNPFVDIQAQARAHRIGQEKTVLVYQLITKCSVEEKILQRSRKKLAMENLVMSPTSKVHAGDINALLLHGAQKVLDEHDIEATSIKFTDETIKKLLDRKIRTCAEDQDAQAHGYLGAVEGSSVMSDTVNEQEELNSKGSDGTEWLELLRNVAEQDEMEELGRGKRVRKQVMYKVEGHAEGQEDDEYDPTSDTESHSSSDVSLDSEGPTVKALEAARSVPGNMRMAEYTGINKSSVPFGYSGHTAGTSGHVLPGASVSVSPFPQNSPLLASMWSERGFQPPLMGPSTSMMFPFMSAGATLSRVVGSTSATGVIPRGSAPRVLLPRLPAGVSSSHVLESACRNFRMFGDNSGHVSHQAAGFPSATMYSGAGISGSHSQGFYRPFPGMHPHVNNFSANTNTAGLFPGVPAPYFPYYPPPFLTHPMSTNLSNPGVALSNLQQAIHGWKGRFDGKNTGNLAVSQVTGSTRGMTASGHGSISGPEVSKISSPKSIPSPSPSLHAQTGLPHSPSNPVESKRGTTFPLFSTFPAAPWGSGCSSASSICPPSQVELKMIVAAPQIPTVTSSVTASAVPLMPGTKSQSIPSYPTMYPACDSSKAGLHSLTAMPTIAQSPNIPIAGLAVVNSMMSPVRPKNSVPEFPSPFPDAVRPTSLPCQKSFHGTGSSTEPPTILLGSLTSQQSVEDSMPAPRWHKKCTRTMSRSTPPTSKTPKLLLSRKKPEDSTSDIGEVNRILIDEDLPTSGKGCPTDQSPPLSDILGEQVGDEVGSNCIPEQNHELGFPTSSLKPPVQSRKPLWVPKGDAGLLMGHPQEYGGPLGATVLKHEI